MFRNYKSIWRREILTEKVIDPTRVFYIYTNQNRKLKFPEKQQHKQRERAKAMAKELGFKKTVLFHEFFVEADESLFGECFMELLRLVQQNIAKNIYMDDVNLITDNKYIRAFVISYFETAGVNLYTRNGIHKIGYDDYEGINGNVNYLRDYDIFIGLIEQDNDVHLKYPNH